MVAWCSEAVVEDHSVASSKVQKSISSRTNPTVLGERRGGPCSRVEAAAVGVVASSPAVSVLGSALTATRVCQKLSPK